MDARFKGHIENYIGTVQIPVGLAGPVLVNGTYANGCYEVPMATTEGSLVRSYHRGMRMLNYCGGVHVAQLKNVMHISPAIVVSNENQKQEIADFLKNNLDVFKSKVELHSQHIRLTHVSCEPDESCVFCTFFYDTADAMGLNSMCLLTELLMELLQSEIRFEKYYLRSNLSSDKKISLRNETSGYGRKMEAFAEIDEVVLKRFMGVNVDNMVDYFNVVKIASKKAGMLGMNGQFANGIAAVFSATGQDIAQVLNSAMGEVNFEKNEEGKLVVKVQLSQLLIATVGGGTELPDQKRYLEMMDCKGSGKASKLAEIITATILAGEISLAAAIVKGNFLNLHRVSNGQYKSK